MRIPDKCSHGRSWKDPCHDCEKVLLNEVIRNANATLKAAENRLKEIENEIS